MNEIIKLHNSTLGWVTVGENGITKIEFNIECGLGFSSYPSYNIYKGKNLYRKIISKEVILEYKIDNN